MFGNISSKVLSTPRVFFAASRDELIPIKQLSKIHSKFTTPHIAIITYACLCFLFAIAGGFKELAIISSATGLLISLGISIAVIKLRRDKRFNSAEKTFKVPGGYTIPIVSSIAILWFLSNLSKAKIFAVCLSIIILSLLYFFIKFKTNSSSKK